MKFELTILGSGSSIPTSNRNSAAQVLHVLGRYFLIDCAEATQHQLRRFHVPYNKINHIFISHLHGDHFFGLIGFLSTLSLQGRRGEMHIYAEPRLQELFGCQMKTGDNIFITGTTRVILYGDSNKGVNFMTIFFKFSFCMKLCIAVITCVAEAVIQCN